MPSIARRRGDGSQSANAPAARTATLGEFLGSARWIVTPIAHAVPAEKFAPEHPQPAAQENFLDTADLQDADAAGPDTELGPLLGAIADDVHGCAAAARSGIMADFAARVAYARKHLSGPALAAVLATLKQARQTALTFVKRSAALELAGRKKAVIAARRRPLRPRRTGGRIRDRGRSR